MKEPEVERVLNAIRINSLDDAAWSDFYLHYRGQILGMLAMNGIKDRDVREELAAEVFFRFARYCPWKETWEDLPRPGEIGAYIRTTTENVLRAWLRDIARVADLSGREPAVGSIENAILSANLLEKLRPAEQRFLAAYVESGFDLRTVAERLGISYAAAGTRLHRIRRRIQDLGDV